MATKPNTDLPQPFKSWTFDEDLGYWVAPTPIPDVTQPYNWNDKTGEWELLEFPVQ